MTTITLTRQTGKRTHGESHGKSRTREYESWCHMITRCTNPNCASFHRYGGRGIKICDRWREYENFLCDMGRCPKGMTLDRINNDGNYEPGNCRWATWSQQAFNRHQGSARYISIDGETHTMAEWERIKGMKSTAIHARLKRGWTERAAVMTPLRQERERILTEWFDDKAKDENLLE